MDIQLSGAVDLSPLFNQMNKPGLQFPKANIPARNYQGEMLASQTSMLDPLNQQYGAPLLGQASIGSTVNLIA